MKTTIRRNSWLVTVPLAAAAVAYISLSFLPERRAIGKARQQVRQKQDYIVRAGSLATALQIAKQELKKTGTYNTAWEQHAPAQAELSGLYGKIHELAKAAGVTITRFNPEPVVRYEKISRIPIGMGCVGSFAQICEFLEGLEGLPLKIWANECHLARGEQNGQGVSCELTLDVFTCNLENSDYVEHTE